METSNPDTVIARLAQAQQNKRHLEELYVELIELRNKRTLEESEKKGNWFTNLQIQKVSEEIKTLLTFNRQAMFLIPGGKSGKREHVARPVAKNAQLKRGTSDGERQSEEPRVGHPASDGPDSGQG